MKIFIFDCETTGLTENRSLPLDKQPEIIEFAGLLLDSDTGEVSGEIDRLFKPSRPITAEITKITGLTDDDVKEAYSFAHGAPAIVARIEAADAVCAHNASFDIEVMDIQMERLGQTIKWPKLKLCTVELTIHLKGYRLSLTELHTLLFDEPPPAAHRAMRDVETLTRCVKELLKMGEI